MNRLLLVATFAVMVSTVGAAQSLITDPSCKGVIHGLAMDEGDHAVAGLRVVLNPIGIDLSYILPTTQTDKDGEYHFDHVCKGHFTVFVQDERAGYAMSIWYLILGKFHEVTLTPEHMMAEVQVDVPPKAGMLEIRTLNRSTNSSLRNAEVRFKFVNHKNFGWIRINYISGETLLVPSNTELLCQVTSEGFAVWKGGNRKGRRIKLGPGERLTLQAVLAPKRG